MSIFYIFYPLLESRGLRDSNSTVAKFVFDL